MIDGFALLTPLIVLPIVLLFAFVGCALDRSGAGSEPVRLQVPGGLGATVQSLSVTFHFQPANDGATFGQTSQPQVLTGSQLAAASTVEDQTLVSPIDEGTVTCDCTVVTSATQVSVTKSSPPHEKAEDETVSDFSFVGDGNSFNVV